MLGRAAGRAAGSGLERDVGGIDRLGRWNADGIAQPALCQTGPELRHFAIFGIGSHTAEHRPGTPDAIDFLQGDAPLRLELNGQWNAGAQTTVRIPRPGFRQERAQPDADRHLAAGQGE